MVARLVEQPGSPASEQELLARAVALSGLPLAEVAAGLGRRVPRDARRAKGWIGRLVETALGASAGAGAQPDFPHLGVELKTIPVREDGWPVESTWVTRVALLDPARQSWAGSDVRKKLARVLWMPVQSPAAGSLGQRRLGSPLLWSPDAAQEAGLRADFEDLMERVVHGEVEDITALEGRWLQIRPKGADAAERVQGVDADGQQVPVAPRGFYLRAAFTALVLRRGFGLE